MKQVSTDLLRAPLTLAPLRFASPEELKQINSCIESGQVQNRSGVTILSKLEDCLICDSDNSCFPVRNSLPILIVGEAFTIPKR